MCCVCCVDTRQIMDNNVALCAVCAVWIQEKADKYTLANRIVDVPHLCKTDTNLRQIWFAANPQLYKADTKPWTNMFSTVQQLYKTDSNLGQTKLKQSYSRAKQTQTLDKQNCSCPIAVQSRHKPWANGVAAVLQPYKADANLGQTGFVTVLQLYKADTNFGQAGFAAILQPYKADTNLGQTKLQLSYSRTKQTQTLDKRGYSCPIAVQSRHKPWINGVTAVLQLYKTDTQLGQTGLQLSYSRTKQTQTLEKRGYSCLVAVQSRHKPWTNKITPVLQTQKTDTSLRQTELQLSYSCTKQTQTLDKRGYSCPIALQSTDILELAGLQQSCSCALFFQRNTQGVSNHVSQVRADVQSPIEDEKP